MTHHGGASHQPSLQSPLYFRVIQVVKETIKNYEDEQGIQYGKNAVHLDRALVGPLIATFAHLQRELQVVRESRQLA